MNKPQNRRKIIISKKLSLSNRLAKRNTKRLIDTSSSDLELFKMAVEHFKMELGFFWTRANFYLVVTAGLLSITFTIFSGTLSYYDKLICIGISLLGLLLSIIWFSVLRGTAYWIKKWREQVIELDKKIDRFHFYSDIEETVSKVPYLSPTFITKNLPLLFVVVWIIVGIVVIITPAK